MSHPTRLTWIVPAAALIFSALACTAPGAANVEATANAAQATVIAAATITYGQITPQDFQATQVAQTVIAINVQHTLAAQPQGQPTMTLSPGQPTITLQAALPTLPNNTPLPTAKPASDQGVITGKVCYPAGGIPPLNIYVQVAPAGDVIAMLNNPENTQTYSINVSGGSYFVFAYPTTPITPDDMLAGGFTAAVVCGIDKTSCTDHSLVGVTVEPGQTASGVDICDWYAPPGAFPPRPK